jgi:hypothetical protein
MATRDLAVVLDAGAANATLGGLALQGRDGAWVTNVMVSHSPDNRTYTPLGGLYAANADATSVVEIPFPYPTDARFVRIHVVTYFLWPSFRASLVRANRTCAPVPTTTPRPRPHGLCQPAPGRDASFNGTHCVVACRHPGCRTPPRPAAPMPHTLAVRRPQSGAPPPAVRLHRLPAAAWALHISRWQGVHATVAVDNSPFTPIPNTPPPSDSDQWIALSQGPVNASVSIRVQWGNQTDTTTVLRFTLRASRATDRSPAPVAFTAPPQLQVNLTWGLGDPGDRGDTQALGIVTTRPPAAALVAFDPPTLATLAVAHACANATLGVLWLQDALELHGTAPARTLAAFVEAQCSAPTPPLAWLVPQSDSRAARHQLSVNVTCAKE